MAEPGNEKKERFENIFRVMRDGKEVAVKERELTPDEERLLRADELVQGFMLEPLLDEKERIQREIERRQDRIGRLRMTTGATKFMREVTEKVGRIQDGEIPCTELTVEEAKELEKIYARTMPFTMLSPAEEGRLRSEIRKQAVKDHEDGRFQTLNDALKHYNLTMEVEDGTT